MEKNKNYFLIAIESERANSDEHANSIAPTSLSRSHDGS
jgi:hypothetical protein